MINARSHLKKWWGLTALMPAAAMTFTDQSILPVALPTIQKQLGASNVELQWCVNAYLLVTAVLVLAGGKISDRIGHRRTFALGILLFGIASLFCGLSSHVFWLIGSRALQGIGAALMIPASAPLLMSLFPPNERGKAMGINISITSLFLILGPLIGGYLTQKLSWKWIFWVNLPLAALGLLLVFLFIPRSLKGEQKFDGWGFLFFAISSSFLVTAIMQGKDWGWSSLEIIALLLSSLLSAICLFRREKKTKHPFLDLSLFRHPIYKAVNISVFATQFILMITVYWAIFFQDALGWTPLKGGVVTVLSSCPVLFMSPVGGFLSDRFGSKIPVAIGFFLLIFSFFWIPLFIQSSLELLFIGLFAFGMGVPLILTPSYSSAMGTVPPQKAGIAFGILSTVRSLSATLGVAMIGSFAMNIQSHSFKKLIYANPETANLSLPLLEDLSTAAGDSQNYLETVSAEQSQIILGFLKESEISGFFYSHIGLAFALILAFAFVFVLYHRKSSHHLPQAPAEGWD